MSHSRHFTPLRLLIFFAACGALIIIEGHKKIPSGFAQGDGFAIAFPSAPSTRPTLRVAAFNIDGGVGPADNRLDLDRTAAAITGYDVVGMEEVHAHPALSPGPDEAEAIGIKLQTPWLFAPVEKQWWRDAFGNAALTRLPVDHWSRIPISSQISDSNRNLILLQLRWSGQPLYVIITHLERHDDRPAELRTAINLFQSLQTPAILMGDLNTPKDDPQIAVLRKTPGIADPIGDALGSARSDTIDWIFARGLHSVGGGFTDNGASDHPVVWAEFSIP